MAKSYEEFKNVGSTGTDSRLESHSTDSKKIKDIADEVMKKCRSINIMTAAWRLSEIVAILSTCVKLRRMLSNHVSQAHEKTIKKIEMLEDRSAAIIKLYKSGDISKEEAGRRMKSVLAQLERCLMRVADSPEQKQLYKKDIAERRKMMESTESEFLYQLLLEAKNAKTEEERKSVHERIFTKYYGGLNHIADKGARKLTKTADKIASKEGRIANNSDYEDYYKRYSKTKTNVKKGALAASLNAAATAVPIPVPGSGFAIMTPIFAKGAKYSPDPNDAKMIDDIVNGFKQKASAVFKGKKSSEVDVSGAIVAGNSVKAAVKAGNAPDKNDLRIFDNAVNKLKAIMKREKPAYSAESSCSTDDIRILLEGCIRDDIDGAIETIALVIESYDFMNNEINDLFDIAQSTVDLRI